VNDIEVYLRPKIGFCNCDSGVADDDEVDRVADLDLISETVRFRSSRARRSGWPACQADQEAMISVWPTGSRTFRPSAIAGVPPLATFLVAVAQGKGAAPEVAARGAGISSVQATLVRWMTSALDGR